MNKRTHIHVPQKLQDQIADEIAAFSGSWRSVFLHAVVFLAWFIFRLDVALLTNIVSLEAIFLCIFLLMSQNRQSAKDHIRDDHEAQEVDDLMLIQKQQLDILNTQSEVLDLLKSQQMTKKIPAVKKSSPHPVKGVSCTDTLLSPS